MALLYFVAAALLAACGSSAVKMEPPRSSTVPGVGLIETGRGEVKYPVEGWEWVVAARRRSAFKRIAKACASMTFQVIAESTRQDTEVPYSQTDLGESLARGLKHYEVNPFRHIVYECVPKGK